LISFLAAGTLALALALALSAALTHADVMFSGSGLIDFANGLLRADSLSNHVGADVRANLSGNSNWDLHIHAFDVHVDKTALLVDKGRTSAQVRVKR
jgi:hypothetical protein